jgi:error-prone DNA polymerase
LFQEQAMRVAIECAGFTPSEADQLRRSMATFKHTGGVSQFRDKLVAGMVVRGYPKSFAEKTFAQLEGFGSYGFPESHAASFALLAYASSWMKCRHPDVFLAAILNAQPMGFYAPAQLVRDARLHGVTVRPVDVNASRWDCTLEPVAAGKLNAVRLGLRLVRGLVNKDAAAIVAARADSPFGSIDELWRRAAVPITALERLADADAFRPSLGLARRDAVWAIRALRDHPLPLFEAAAAHAETPIPEVSEPAVVLRPMNAGREVVEDYRAIGLTLRPHPVSFLRRELAARHIVACAEASAARDGRLLMTSGLVLVRQRPGSARGVLFITIEDETGIANIVIWPDLFEKQRRVVLSAGMIAVAGRVQREGEVVHVIARTLTDLSPLLRSVGERDETTPLPWDRGNPAKQAGSPDLQPRPQIRVQTRDFR